MARWWLKNASHTAPHLRISSGRRKSGRQRGQEGLWEPTLVSPNNTRVDMNAGKTSPAKIEANRRNAQFSSGPKSPEGKKIVAGNARKHCLLAKDLVIVTGAGKEDQGHFDDLLSQLCDCYQPVGMAEDLCVQELAASYWKSARALRCERGEVTRASTIRP